MPEDYDAVKVKHGGKKVRQSFLKQWRIRKKTGDINLVALHFDSPGFPSYAIAIKCAHFTIFALYDINCSSFCVT